MISIKNSLFILFKSLLNRRLTSLLLLLTLSLSILLLTGLLHLKQELKTSLSRSLSQTDLIVAAQSSSLQLLFSTVFKKGQLTKPLSAASVEKIKNMKDVKWLLPLSLGDSHQGYPVLATTADYFKFFRFGKKQALSLDQGRIFNQSLEVVLGSDVAKNKGYKLGDKLFLSHGHGNSTLSLHKNHNFNIVGILNPTATPVDQTLHVNLASIALIHDQDPTDKQAISAAFLGLKSPFSIFKVQRLIHEWPTEALSAIIPAQAFAELASFMSSFETVLWIFAAFLFICTLLTMMLTFILSQQQRQQEFRILRALGASSSWVFYLLLAEAMVLSIVSFLIARVFLIMIQLSTHSILKSKLGLDLNLITWKFSDLWVALLITGLTLLSALFPAWQSYQQAKSNTLSLLK